MAKDHGPSIKDDRQYERLREQGESKEKAARIANTPRSEAGKKGGKAAKTHVTATVSADKGDAGIKIVSSKLKVVVEGLEGMSASDFATFVKEADKGCPVSNAYRGTMQIEVEGTAR